MFEIDSKSERTLTEEPKTPKFQISRSETPESITKRNLIPVVLPFDSDVGKGPKSRTKSQINPKKPEVNLRKGPEKESKAVEKPPVRPVSLRPDPVTPVLPHEKAAKAPVLRSPPKGPYESPVSTPSSP